MSDSFWNKVPHVKREAKYVKRNPFDALDKPAGHTVAKPEHKGLPVQPGATLIGVLIDHSGSMSICKAAMEAGVNAFVREQAALPGGADITLAEFDTEFDVVWPMQNIAGAPQYVLKPRGGTALLDAMGNFITGIADQLSDEEVWRPVIICVVSDGLENSSREWTRQAVKELVEYWQEAYRWEFIFLGANMDAIAEAGSFGVAMDSALTFDTRATTDSLTTMSGLVTEVRAGKPAQFTEQDRRKALGK